MQTEPTHFIEVVKYPNQKAAKTFLIPILHLRWSLRATKKFGYETIAVFKIYPKQKPVVVTYDYDLKTMITE